MIGAYKSNTSLEISTHLNAATKSSIISANTALPGSPISWRRTTPSAYALLSHNPPVIQFCESDFEHGNERTKTEEQPNQTIICIPLYRCSLCIYAENGAICRFEVNFLYTLREGFYAKLLIDLLCLDFIFV